MKLLSSLDASLFSVCSGDDVAARGAAHRDGRHGEGGGREGKRLSDVCRYVFASRLYLIESIVIGWLVGLVEWAIDGLID